MSDTLCPVHGKVLRCPACIGARGGKKTKQLAATPKGKKFFRDTGKRGGRPSSKK